MVRWQEGQRPFFKRFTEAAYAASEKRAIDFKLTSRQREDYGRFNSLVLRNESTVTIRARLDGHPNKEQVMEAGSEWTVSPTDNTWFYSVHIENLSSATATAADDIRGRVAVLVNNKQW